jgi:hypothetical protein
MLFGLMQKFGEMGDEKILTCSLGLKSEAEKWAVPMGLPLNVVWIDAKVWRNGRRKNFAL